MARARVTGGTPATQALAAHEIDFVLRPYSHDPSAPSFGLEAAHELGESADRVFKTLVADVDGALVVGVVPVSATLDLKALAGAMGGKRAAMADVARAERATGYVIGGISPLGQRRPLPTVIDDSLGQHPYVLVSGGRRGLDLQLSPEDLVRATQALLAPIARRERPSATHR